MEWVRRTARILNQGTRCRKMSSQLHGSVTLPSGNEPPVLFGYEVGWIPDPVWTWWQRGTSLPVYRIEPLLSCYWLAALLTELSRFIIEVTYSCACALFLHLRVMPTRCGRVKNICMKQCETLTYWIVLSN